VDEARQKIPHMCSPLRKKANHHESDHVRFKERLKGEREGKKRNSSGWKPLLNWRPTDMKGGQTSRKNGECTASGGLPQDVGLTAAKREGGRLDPKSNNRHCRIELREKKHCEFAQFQNSTGPQKKTSEQKSFNKERRGDDAAESLSTPENKQTIWRIICGDRGEQKQLSTTGGEPGQLRGKRLYSSQIERENRGTCPGARGEGGYFKLTLN